MVYRHVSQDGIDTKNLLTTDQEAVIDYAERLTLASPEERIRHQKVDAYIAASMQPVLVGDQKISVFAPFQQARSALQTTTPRQRLILYIIGLAYVVGLIFYSTFALQTIIAVITLFYFLDLAVYFSLSVKTIEKTTAIQIDEALIQALADADWPRYTILCPLYRETEVVSQFVKAMQALDYPVNNLQILFLTEENDPATREAIQALHLPPHFEIVTVPDGQPRTKPRACNYGLLRTTGDYVVIYDAEDVPEPLQLKKAVLAFAMQGEKTACIQAKLNFYNPEQNLLTRWFTAEYSAWFDLTLPGLQRLNVPLPLGGTSNHFRTELLRTVGAWDAFNVTEDCDLGLRLGHYDLKTVVMDSTTYEEANSNFKNWLRQRSRWIKGYMQTYLVHMRSPLEYFRPGGLRQFLSLQLFIGGKAAILLVNPLMWLLVSVYIVFNGFVGNAYHTLYPTAILYMGSLCLIFGNFVYTYTHLIGCMKREQHKLIKWTLLIPVYWIMGSIAAYIALYQLIFMPHYWEKTLHGLHLHKTGITSVIEELSAQEVLPANKDMQEDLEWTVTSRSSNISLTAEDLEIEMTEKVTHVKVHTSGRLPAISKQLDVISSSEDVVQLKVQTSGRLPAIPKLPDLPSTPPPLDGNRIEE